MDLRTAAAALGVHYQTAYRWVREGSLAATKRGSAYEITDADLARFAERRNAPVPPPKTANVRSWDHQVDRLFGHLRDGDELAARHQVERLSEGGVEPLVLCTRLFTPALRRVGEAWASGEINVAEEHRAAAICERLLARLSAHPRGRPRGVAVVATPVGEEHGLAAAMASLVLRADRWKVHHLGTEVPADDLLALVRRLEADLVVLSVVFPGALPGARELADAVRRSTDAVALVGAPGTALEGLVVAARGFSD